MKLLLLPLATLPLFLASCGGGGGGEEEDPNAIRPYTLDGLTITVASGANFTFRPYVDQIGGSEAGTFEYTRIGQGRLDSTAGSAEWPESAGMATYTYNIVGPNTADITLLSLNPGAGFLDPPPPPDLPNLLSSAPEPTTLSVLFEVDTRGYLRPFSLVLRDPAIGAVVLDATITGPDGEVPSKYRSARQTQDEEDRPSAIAAQSFNRDAYVFDFGLDGNLYLLHTRTDILISDNPTAGAELGAALVSAVAFAPPNYEVNYSYTQPRGTDDGVLILTPRNPGQPVVPIPVTLRLHYVSVDQGTVVASDGRTGTFIAILRP